MSIHGRRKRRGRSQIKLNSAYLIGRVFKQERLAREPVLDRQSELAKILASDYVLVPDDELESTHGFDQRKVDRKFEGGVLCGIDGVECSFDIRSFFSLTKKRKDYITKGVE